MPKVDYGIEEIMFCKLAADGAFPDFDAAPDTDKISIQMIDIDSFNFNEEENTTQDVEFENADKLTLSGTKGSKGFTFTSSDKEDAVAKFFRGMKMGAAGTDDEGYIVEDPNHDDSGTYAMRIKTKAVGSYPARYKEYTPVLTTVKETGTLGKNSLGKYSFSCVRQPNFDANRNPIRGYREKSITA